LFLTVFLSFVFCCSRISDDIGRGKKVRSSSREAEECKRKLTGLWIRTRQLFLLPLIS
jgi:hypothetical protein